MRTVSPYRREEYYASPSKSPRRLRPEPTTPRRKPDPSPPRMRVSVPVRGEAAAAWRRVVELKEVLDHNRKRVAHLEGDLARTSDDLQSTVAYNEVASTEVQVLRQHLNETRSVIEGLNRQLEATQEVLQLTTRERDEWKTAMQQISQEAQEKDTNSKHLQLDLERLKQETERVRSELSERSQAEMNLKYELQQKQQAHSSAETALQRQLKDLEEQKKIQQSDAETNYANLEARSKRQLEDLAAESEQRLRHMDAERGQHEVHELERLRNQEMERRREEQLEFSSRESLMRQKHADEINTLQKQAGAHVAKAEAELTENLRLKYQDELTRERREAAARLARRESELEEGWKAEAEALKLTVEKVRDDTHDKELNIQRLSRELEHAKEERDDSRRQEADLMRRLEMSQEAAGNREGSLSRDLQALHDQLRQQEVDNESSRQALEVRLRRQYEDIAAELEKRLEMARRSQLEEQDLHQRELDAQRRDNLERRSAEQAEWASKEAHQMKTHHEEIERLQSEAGQRLAGRERELEERFSREIEDMRRTHSKQVEAMTSEATAQEAMHQEQRRQYEESMTTRTEGIIKEMQASMEEDMRAVQERFQEERDILQSRLQQKEAEALAEAREGAEREARLREDIATANSTRASSMREVAFLTDKLAMAQASMHGMQTEVHSLKTSSELGLLTDDPFQSELGSPTRSKALSVAAPMTNDTSLTRQRLGSLSFSAMPSSPSPKSHAAAKIDYLSETPTVSAGETLMGVNSPHSSRPSSTSGTVAASSLGTSSVMEGRSLLKGHSGSAGVSPMTGSVEGARSVREALEEKSARLRAVLEAANSGSRR
ncbi:hypothetical protein CYMTET_23182 [Cymbomonas tetramitiformis]|uniref:Uncharacterized protein n=1 Tax=Cymbomonas tetramitiformis TaxID=36881 RepID=A0AAE0FYX6_9CHLO|nr:hypothetical protein CYMTET_23182 [Cymbomonas tetramitiformis]